MKSKVLILTNPLNHEGGVVNYYNLFLDTFKSDAFELKHQNIGSRDWVFYYSILKIILYPFFYFYDMLRLCFNLISDRKIKIVQLSPSMIPVSLIRDAIPVALAKLFRKKVVIFYRGWRVETFSHISNRKLIRYLFNKVYQSSTHQIVLATSFKESLLSLKKSQTDEIMVTTTSIRKNDIIFSDKKLDDLLKVLFLGRIEGLKGAKEIIEAICKLNAQNKLKYFEFNFVGHENELGYIENLKYILKENNIEESKVKFKGRITGRQKFKEFASNDIYLFPSYTEGCPTSVLEALASGLFCITTPVGALEEIVIPNINGLHIKIKSVDDIVDALLLCKANKMLLNRRYEISKEAITKFEITHICNKFNLFYNKIYS